MTDEEIVALDAVGAAAAIASGELTAERATAAHLGRIAAVNPRLNAVVHQMDDEALRAARAADAARSRGARLGPLHGVPVTVKINVDQAGWPTDNGARPFRTLVAKADAPVVARLRAAGAIIIGRTNSPAMALRFMTENALHGLTVNPWSARSASGGSSGGAAAACAAGIGTIAHGNDIGGSIRWPAFCCGVLGLRPTMGRIPGYNATSAGRGRSLPAQIMATNGALARSVRDLALALRVMQGPDPRDPATVPVPIRRRSSRRPLRVALMTDPPGPAVHPAARAAVDAAGRALAAAGCDVDALPASAFPALFEGATELWNRIGMTDIRASLEPLLPAIGDEGLTRSLENWWTVLPSAAPAEVRAGHAERDLVRRLWFAFLSIHDVVVTPTFGAAHAAPGADAGPVSDMADLLQNARFLLGGSILGVAELAMPIGVHDGLPQGVQLIAGPFREDRVLEAAALIEAGQGPRRPITPGTEAGS